MKTTIFQGPFLPDSLINYRDKYGYIVKGKVSSLFPCSDSKVIRLYSGEIIKQAQFLGPAFTGIK